MIALIMNTIASLSQAIPTIEAKLGYTFKNPELLTLAFIHRSYINENRDITSHNERMEFLGDSVLGLIVAEKLYRDFPDIPEGELSDRRSRLVEAASCMQYVQQLDLGEYILMGKGERMNDGRGRESILADLFEAIIGAIYLDGGLEAARQFLLHHFAEEILITSQIPFRNWKATLQEYCQKHFQKPPQYIVKDEEGPDHSKIFRIVVVFNEQEMGCGTGASKKEAQQAAAGDALRKIEEGQV